MKRRDFIRTSSVAGIAVPFLTLGSCDTRKRTSADPPPFELQEVMIDVLQQKMSQGTLSARSLTQAYLNRISAVDRSGPALNSVIEINPDALTIADQLDEERRLGKVRGPLHGIPVLIKDNIDTADKMMTTAGSLALDGNRALKDAFIISKLREAGVVILGKTNLSEWANFRSTRSSSGWSSRGGQTKNPYAPERNPCGSSSGSAVAVSANLCAVAIGTETNGSIACPSSVNGIVGIKPTVGLWSRAGIIPISHTQDTAGPMARTVKDAAIVLGVAAYADPADQVTMLSEGRTFRDYTKFLDPGALKGKRIGVEKKSGDMHEGVESLWQRAIGDLKKGGAGIVEVDLGSRVKIGPSEFDLLKYEFKDGVNRYLSGAAARVKSLKDVIDFNKENESRMMPFFRQEILESSEAMGDLGSSGYKEALSKVLSVRAAIDQVMKENELDALCGPSAGPSWCTDLINGDFYTGSGMYSSFAAMAGYPHITVPMGLVHGLPVGLNLVGTAFSEGSLLGLAFGYEQISQNRVSPAM